MKEKIKEIEEEINRLVDIVSGIPSRDSIDDVWNEIKEKYGKKFEPELEAVTFMGLGISWVLAKIFTLTSKMVNKGADELQKYLSADDLAFIYVTLKDKEEIVRYMGKLANIYIRLAEISKQ